MKAIVKNDLTDLDATLHGRQPDNNTSYLNLGLELLKKLLIPYRKELQDQKDAELCGELLSNYKDFLSLNKKTKKAQPPPEESKESSQENATYDSTVVQLEQPV